ncbi:hypothetical protein [Clostridium beijerinckii]|uniref:hypothetical protein n=1 Tax=Clostridium beijerinckii TaxID=1520 RepID=UPI00156F6666|nr:hypothetical protein [Clostridium beijerinckii]NRU52565.1 hypothetical protein [Clostridium beijerinckii]NYC69258.1 hypothetical protein [Clostridium beijerinckii]NYC91766.1 hypothetical protein [Clostridium beijerinckii]
MSEFNSVEDFYTQLQTNIGETLRDEAEKIKEIIQDYMVTVIYTSYAPEIYERTYELLNSIIIDYRISGSEYIAEIKIDPQMLQSPSNSYNENPLPITEIAELFAEGRGYKRNGRKMDVIGDTYENYVEVGNALKDIIGMLKSKGYDFE